MYVCVYYFERFLANLNRINIRNVIVFTWCPVPLFGSKSLWCFTALIQQFTFNLSQIWGLTWLSWRIFMRSFSPGYSRMLCWAECPRWLSYMIDSSWNPSSPWLLAGSSVKNIDRSTLHLVSACGFGCSQQRGWFPREITPRRAIQRDLVGNLEGSSDLALEIPKHHNLFS